jgi:hypothetical protein
MPARSHGHCRDHHESTDYLRWENILRVARNPRHERHAPIDPRWTGPQSFAEPSGSGAGVAGDRDGAQRFRLCGERLVVRL